MELKNKNFGGEKEMKSTKAWAVVAAVSMVFALAFAAEARPFGPKRGMKFGLGGLKGFLELKLSDAQQGEMMNIINKYQSEREGLRDRMIEARRNLKAVLHAEPFNEGEARKAFQEASAMREEVFVLRARMMTELRGILTPEQKELIKERRAQRAEKMKQRLETWLESSSQ
jgi:Spy/CpxP family protein refolding chaperone